MIDVNAREDCTAYCLVLVRPSDRTVVVDMTPDGPHLPWVEVHSWARQAEQLQRAIHDLWRLNSVLVEVLACTSGGPPYAIAEILSPQHDISQQFSSLTEFSERAMPREDCKKLEDFLWGDCGSHSPLARLGWVALAKHWIEEIILDRPSSLCDEVYQLNAGGGFELARFRTRQGRAYWLKATGEPNLHEFGVTSALARYLPQFLPNVLAKRADWNAWLMEDAGSSLRERSTLPAWKQAVVALATLEQKSISHLPSLLDCGCQSQRLTVLLDQLNDMIDYLEAAMAQQVSTKAPRLSRAQLETIGSALNDACMCTLELKIPDTLIHGDINPGNILFDGDRCVFIDWADAYIGNPLLAFERLMVHLRRESSQAAAWAPSLKAIYKRQWLGRVSAAVIDQAFVFAPLLAIATCLLGRGDRLRSARGEDPGFRGFARNLARRMYAITQSVEARGVPC